MSIFIILLIQLLLIINIQKSECFNLNKSPIVHSNGFGMISGSRWSNTVTAFPHLGPGSHNDLPISPYDEQDRKHRNEFILNVGRAMEGLRKELPLVFVAPDLDFSIFANQITIIDEGQRKIEISKTIYMTAIKSIRMASSFSSIYPSMNVRKIEYIEDMRTIQCLVDVVLPDAVRVDGQVC